MKISKFLTNPVLVMFTAVAFLFLVTGCDRTVTKYDKDGKPYSAKEFDPWMTIGGIILTMLAIGAIAAAADSSHLDTQSGIRLVSLNRPDTENWMPVEVIDREDNLIGKQMLNLDKTLLYSRFLDISRIQLFSQVNEKAIKNLIKSLKQNPADMTKLKARVFLVSDNPIRLKIKDLSMPDKSKQTGYRLMVHTEYGDYMILSDLVQENPKEKDVTILKLDCTARN